MSCLRAGVSITRALAHMLDSLVRVSRRVGSQCPTRRQNLVPGASTGSARGALRERAPKRECPHRQNRAEAQRFACLQRFHILFNSLPKVLFIFPSRYLFAIGLSPIFSFGRVLPPTSRCIPKQRYSKRTGKLWCRKPAEHGIFTLSDFDFHQIIRKPAPLTRQDYNSQHAEGGAGIFD